MTKKSFWIISRYAILLYVIGDIVTTFTAINKGLGYESNPFLSFVNSDGIWSLILLKVVYICMLYALYWSIPKREYNICIEVISIIGSILIINNSAVIAGII